MENVLEVQQKEEAGIRSRRSALLMGSAALAGLALSRNASAQTAITDTDILNFALNLEYLEAQFYSLAVNGTTIDASLLASGDGKTAAGTVTYKPGLKPTNFVTPQLKAYAMETANDELNHVKFLRSALNANGANAAVAMQNINLVDSFNTLAAAAKIPGGTFDPFDGTETSFLLGAFVFEDVGVTAYLGAAPLIQSAAYLAAALDIHAVEAYHAGAVRTRIFGLGAPATTDSGLIAAARATLAGSGSFDIGVGTSLTNTPSTIVDADSSSRVMPRTTTQVLNIVYGGDSTKPGVFFPQGMNGTIK